MNLFQHRQGRHRSTAPPATAIDNPARSLSKKNGSFRLGSEERTKKNRKSINTLLKHVGHQIGKDLALCSKGICYFSYKQFLIVIEVPEDSDSYFMSTMVFRLAPHQDRFLVLQSCMELNYMQQATKGSTLGIEGDEVNLCFSAPVCGLTKDMFEESLENFIVVVEDVNKRLHLATR